MSTKVFHDFPEVCAEEVCGPEEAITAFDDDFLEPEYNSPIPRSQTSSQDECIDDVNKLTSTRSRADSGALLDMLAEVASQKLLFSPMKRKPGSNLEKFDTECSQNVSQVKSLSTNQLIKLFSTTEFDEIKKLYSFHCSFDQNCSAKFISFGNESRAKEKFKKHLFLHLETLKIKDTKQLKKPLRKKNVSLANKKKNIQLLKTEMPNPNYQGTFHHHDNDEDGDDYDDGDDDDDDDDDDGDYDNDDDDNDGDGGGNDGFNNNDQTDHCVRLMKKRKIKWNQDSLIGGLNEVASHDSKQPGFLFEEKNPKVEVEMVTEETTPVDLNIVAENSAALDLNKLIAGLTEKMGVSGVVGEHGYYAPEKPLKIEPVTSSKGEEKPEQGNEVKVFHPSEELRHFMDIETKDTVMVCVLEGNSVVLKHLPPVGQQIDVESTTVSEENRSKLEYNVIRSSDLPVIANNRTNARPPATAFLDPSALWELNHGVNIERDEFQQARKPKGKAKFIGQSKIEKERALEAIEAIRKKTGGGGLDTLQCTICQPPRAFTAPTTLISHYRSHAGIKPYECRICNAVFTRQHSLNYHMLIHTNQTRFTCQDCGRKFRHPSHFKEHRRRHTGESPFECSDCLMRFKTRNTYKRHLRTRHGKVLTTSGGLIILSEDEFQMVRTVPRQNIAPVKRGRPRKVNSLNGATYDRENVLYDENTIDAIDEDIQALHQLEIVTSHEGTYDTFSKENSMDIDEMPVDFITDENDETGNCNSNAAYEEIVKEAVRLEKAEREKKLESQLNEQVSMHPKFILQNKCVNQSDEETIIIETEDPLTGSGLYLATLEDGETVLVNTNNEDDEDDEEEDEDEVVDRDDGEDLDSARGINLGFKLVEVGRPHKFKTQNLAQFSGESFSENTFSPNSNTEPTVIVIKNEPLT